MFIWPRVVFEFDILVLQQMGTKCPKQSMNLPVYVFKVRLYFISNGVIVLGSQDGFQMGRKAEAAG